MAIEIRELLIKVKIEEGNSASNDQIDIHQIKQSVLKECKKEIRKQLRKYKER